MSSQSDDSNKIAASSAPSTATTPGTQVSFEDGVLERYLLGMLRPDEFEAATQFFSDPIRARALRNFQIWAEQEPGVTPPDRSQKLTKLWEKICESEQPGTPSFLVAAQRAGRDVAETVQSSRSSAALGTQIHRTAGQKGRGFAGRTLRQMPSLKNRALRSVFLFTSAIVTAILAFFVVSHKITRHLDVTYTYATRAGQQATVLLVDGTRVTLAPRTTLRLTHFSNASRVVVLDGQAYFDVARSAGTPFLVRTGFVTTRVLGTAFLIRHYAEDALVHVAVAEGKVDVESANPGRPLSSPLLLTAGHTGDVTDSTIIVNAVTDLTAETDWLHGRLVFRSASVDAVLQTLTRWYGYQFRCSDSTLAHRSVTIALDAGSSAAALASLERLLNVHMTFVGDTVTLTSHSSRATKESVRKQNYDVWIPTREVGR